MDLTPTSGLIDIAKGVIDVLAAFLTLTIYQMASISLDKSQIN